MRGLFNINNPVMRFIIKLFDCIVLSVLWAVFSLPIITMGAATTALYYTVYHYLREEEGYLWKYFWNSFKENFKRSTLASLALLAMLAFLIYDAPCSDRRGDRMGDLSGCLLCPVQWYGP